MIDKILEEDLTRIAERCADLKELYGSTVLVTGATGLVGSMTAKALLMMNEKHDAGIRVLAQIRNSGKADRVFAEWKSEALSYVTADLNEGISVDEPVDYIVHTASPTASKYFVEHPVETIGTAVDGSRAMLELGKEKKIRGMVYLSSMEAFGITDPALACVREDDLGYIDIHAVRSSYSESKRVCELLCSCYAAEYGLPVRIARLAQTFGAGIPYEENRVFAQFAKAAMNGQDIVLHTAGKSVGNYCYTADAVTAILLLLVRGEAGSAYTVANEKSNTTIADMARMVADRLAGGRIRLVFDIPESALTYGYAPDVNMRLNADRLRALGWEPTVSLEDSYRRMIASMELTRGGR